MSGLRGKAVVVVAHGEGYILMWQADWQLADMMSEEGFSNGEGGDAESLLGTPAFADGVYIGELVMEDVGASGWDNGSREYAPALAELRSITAAEWTEARTGNWPWDDTFETAPEPREFGGISGL